MNNEENQNKEMTDSTTKDIKIQSSENEWRDTIPERNVYYVYHLIDPKDGLPFYVGKGKGKRMFDHEKRVLRGNFPNNNGTLFYKIRKILNNGNNVIYTKISENLESKSALSLEVDEIKKYGRRDNNTGILCNMTDGGDGFNNRIIKKSTREKLSRANKNRVITWGKKISESLRRDPMTLLERAKKISLANRGRIMTDESKQNMSKARVGKRDSFETKMKKSKSQRGRVYASIETERLRNMGKKNKKDYTDDIINHVKLFSVLFKKPFNVYEILSQTYPNLTYLDVRSILKVGEYKNK